MAAHALLSPSGAHRWTSCTASPSQSAGKRSESSEAAMQGTAEHQVSGECLESGASPDSYIGRTLLFYRDANGVQQEQWDFAGVERPATVFHTVTIDEDSAARCMAYVQFVRDLVAARGGVLYVEQRLPIDHVTGEPGATGTSDAVLVCGDELVIADAKFGRSKVTAYDVIKPAVLNGDGIEVEPAVYEPNMQLAMYAEGALREFGWMGEFKTVRMIIVQPAISHVSEYAHSVEKHSAFIQRIRELAEVTRTAPTFNPTADNCFFCSGRFDCSARNAAALALAANGFADPDEAPAAVLARIEPDRHLGTLYSKLPFIERWVEDIKTRVADSLAKGIPVVRDDGRPYGLAPGKAKAREWDDEKAAEEALSKMRLGDAMYTRKLITPTAAEKLTKLPKGSPEDAKPPLGQRQWNKLEKLIVRPEPNQVVVLLDAVPAAPDSSTDLFS